MAESPKEFDQMVEFYIDRMNRPVTSNFSAKEVYEAIRKGLAGLSKTAAVF